MEVPERHGTNVPPQPTVPPMPESNKAHEYPGVLIPVKIAKELTNSDLKLVIKELHNITLELHNLNSILRRK